MDVFGGGYYSACHTYLMQFNPHCLTVHGKSHNTYIKLALQEGEGWWSLPKTVCLIGAGEIAAPTGPIVGKFLPSLAQQFRVQFSG